MRDELFRFGNAYLGDRGRLPLFCGRCLSDYSGLETMSHDPESWKGRLILERQELGERLQKLRRFLEACNTNPGAIDIEPIQLKLMQIQAHTMASLHKILTTRLEVSKDD